MEIHAAALLPLLSLFSQFICSAQNTQMTNSESKYNPFVACATLGAQIIHHLTSKIDLDMPQTH